MSEVKVKKTKNGRITVIEYGGETYVWTPQSKQKKEKKK